MHRSRLAGFIIDCDTTDLQAAARFWGGALGMEVRQLPAEEGNRYVRLVDPSGRLHVEVQTVSHPSRVHLDIESDDVEAEVRRLEGLGARRVQQVHTWWVMEAPTGQRFCVVRMKADAPRPVAHYPLEGGCDCRAVRYRLETPPLFVHCCHCRWCQRESGASFALNAMIEASRVTLLQGTPEIVDTPSNSGKGQRIARCPHCRVAVWSNYAGAGPLVHFVRVGTLDEPDRLPPDIHIFTSSKQPWVVLPEGVPAVTEYYDRRQYWPADSLARREALLAVSKPRG